MLKELKLLQLQLQLQLLLSNTERKYRKCITIHLKFPHNDKNGLTNQLCMYITLQAKKHAASRQPPAARRDRSVPRQVTIKQQCCD